MPSEHPVASRWSARTVSTSPILGFFTPRPIDTLAGKLALRSTCPVCEHTPISQDDCKPNKSLRMTTRAFLKTAEKKRDSSLAKESTPITPVDARPTSTPTVAEDNPPFQDSSADTTAAPAQDAEQVAEDQGPPAEQDAAPAATEENKEDGPPTVENEVR